MSSQAVSDVFAERERQKSAEHWSTEHDDEHVNGELAQAAACYALNAAAQTTTSEYWRDRYNEAAHQLFPWDSEWWKPKDPRRDLIRAAALTLAEIERLDRHKNQEGK